VRSAERARIWSAIQKAPKRDVQLVSFSFSNIPGIRDGALRFRSPITAICGINGAGKSSLLRAIWATLSWEEMDNHPEIKERLKTFASQLDIEINGQKATLTAASQALASPVTVLHIDPSTTVGQLQRFVCNINELDELIESHAPIVLEEDEVSLLNSILNKSYDSASIFEIDDYAEEAPFPIICVSENGNSYDIRTMSLGEISVFNVFWALQRAQKNSIVLLEEPETFLSPVSQGALLDYLAVVCVKKQLSIVMTTHSPQMFSRLNVEQVQFAYRTATGAALADDSEFDTMREAVGIKPLVDKILLVEDRAARELSLNILRKLDHKSLIRSELISLGGHGDITRVCQSFPHSHSSFQMVAIYDGDVRTEISALDPKWPFVFLPGTDAIEVAFRNLLERETGPIAKGLGRSEAELAVALAKLRGLDHHDWFEEVAQSLHVSYAELMHACYEQWIEDEWIEAQVENFLFDLRKVLR